MTDSLDGVALLFGPGRVLRRADAVAAALHQRLQWPEPGAARGRGAAGGRWESVRERERGG